MTEYQTCHISKALILAFGFTFFIVLIFNVYINHKNYSIPHKLPQINPLQLYNEIREEAESTTSKETAIWLAKYLTNKPTH